MPMTTIIQWCNQNSGFVNAVLAFSGFLMSVIAISVSIYTARLPYKKKLLLSAGNYVSATGERGFHITVTNIGNRPIQIVLISFQIDDGQKLNYFDPFQTKNYADNILVTSKQTGVYYDNNLIKNFQKILRKNKITGNIYIYAEDTEGTKYRKFFLTCEEMLNYKG